VYKAVKHMLIYATPYNHNLHNKLIILPQES